MSITFKTGKNPSCFLRVLENSLEIQYVSYRLHVAFVFVLMNMMHLIFHWGKADDRNYNYGHPKMADVESGKNLFCRLNCFDNVF